MRSKVKLIIILSVLALFLTGCKSTLLVHNTTVNQIIPVVKDYVGTHGYQITYQNDQTGSYGVDLGSVYVPYTSETEKTKMVIVQPPSKNSNQPLTSYENTTWNTVSTPGHYVRSTATINILQQDSDVLILLDTSNATGTSLGDLRDYIQTLGYAVENK
ncbi:MAG: hypothetical protein NT030_05870 [Candidatus Saganbacteria bacterium]|nr:hypothetical protein [Candidatus Saganbacteria bacterium]